MGPSKDETYGKIYRLASFGEPFCAILFIEEREFCFDFRDGRMDSIKNKFRDAPLSQKLNFIFLFGVVLPFGLLSMLVIFQNAWKNQNGIMENAQQGYAQALSYLDYRFYYTCQTVLDICNDEEIRDMFRYEPWELETGEQLERYSGILDMMQPAVTMQDIENIRLYVGEGYIFSDVSQYFGHLELLESQEWYTKAKSTGGSLCWTVTEEGRFLTSVKPIVSPEDLMQEKAYIRTDVSRTEIEKVLGRSIVLGEQDVFLVSEAGEVLASGRPDTLPGIDIDEIKRIGRSSQETFSFQRINGVRYYIKTAELPYADCYLISMFPVWESWKASVRTLLVMLGVLVLITDVTCRLYAWLAGNISKRIQRLNDSFEEISMGDLRRLAVNCGDEIGVLTQNYNEMVGKMEGLMQEQFEMGKKMSQAELLVLQSQINPHFLYNTLDMIKWLAVSNKLEEVNEVIESLSEYYKLTLNRGRDIISIRDDIQICIMYAKIQNKRFDDSIDIKLEVADDVLEYAIPKITLQPLVENAIMHGIRESKKDHGTVWLTGKLEAGEIVLAVRDDGVGMAVAGGVQKGGSKYGLRNIEQRLQLFFDIPRAMDIKSLRGIGTTVTIRIPAKALQQGGTI